MDGPNNIRERDMRKLVIICLVATTALLSSCHIYKAYERPDDLTVSGLYRDTVSVNDTLASDTANFGNVPWREVFTDPQLQAYIEEALENNADLRSAALSVEQAKASLMSARLSYLPSFTFSPQGTVTSFNHQKASQAYSIPVNASWQVDLFAQLLNSHRNAKVTYRQTQYYQQAVQTQIIASVATMYYTLLMLDKQYQITEETAGLMKKTVETMEAMYDAAMTNSASVASSRTSYAQTVASLTDIKESMRQTENSFCLLLNKPSQHLERGSFDDQKLPSDFSVGIPLQMLSNRPDVKAAEMSLAACYYNTNSARAAFYPAVTLTGSLGWTNSYGVISNPGHLLATAVASITQPLFYRGKLVAALRQAKAAEEQAKLTFQTTLLSAGNDVNNALYQYQMNAEKAEARTMQVESAKQAYEDTQELWQLGTSTTYLEVISAQASYLSAQLSQVADTYDKLSAVVSLYQALGGGREEIEE